MSSGAARSHRNKKRGVWPSVARASNKIRRITETSDNGRVKPMRIRCFCLARKTLDEMG